MSKDIETPAKKAYLEAKEEIVGIYRKMQTDPSGTTLTLELDRGKMRAIFLPNGSIEQVIIRKALRCVKRGLRLGIRRLNDPNMPIMIQKFYNLKSKELTFYIDVVTGERLEKLREPGKPLQTSVVKALDIIDGRETVVAVVNQDQLRCNKMKNMGETDRFYCTMLQASICKRYCMEKCIVATQLKILNEAR